MADYLVTETQITFCAWLVKATSEEDARKVWEGSGPDVQLVDQQVTDSQGLTITEGAGGYLWPTPPDTEHAAALRQIRGLATWEGAKAKGEIYRIATDALGGHGGEPCGNSPWDALEAAQFWLQEEAASERPGQTKPDEILRVIGDALAGRPVHGAVTGPARASLVALLPLAEARAEDLEMLSEGDEGGSMDAGPDATAARSACDAARRLLLADAGNLADVLARAESFIAGFEDDDLQEGIPELLRDLRAAQGKEG